MVSNSDSPSKSNLEPKALEWVTESEATTPLSELLRPGDRIEREIHQLVRPMPAPDPDFESATRDLERGADEDAILEINNAAFSWHPDQAGWDRARLDALLNSECSVAASCRILTTGTAALAGPDQSDQVIGFCITKLHEAAHHQSQQPASVDSAHPENRPDFGEIFLIAVHPDFAGQGLGRLLTAASLDWMSRTANPKQAMLWVESTNLVAQRTYASMGFVLHDRRWGISRAEPTQQMPPDQPIPHTEPTPPEVPESPSPETPSR